MLFGKKLPPEITIETCETLLLVKCFVNQRYEAKMNCITEENKILIGDIHHRERSAFQGKHYNKGYGSLMMEKLIDYAKNNGYQMIYGSLSVVDLGHKDRLHHFYEKFGFTITEYEKQEGCFYGKIEKSLKEV